MLLSFSSRQARGGVVLSGSLRGLPDPPPCPPRTPSPPSVGGPGVKVRPHAARSIRSVQAAVPAVKTSDRQGKEVTRTAGMRACNFAPTLPALHAACFAVAAPRAPTVRKMPLSCARSG